jgi:hypothetical protein
VKWLGFFKRKEEPATVRIAEFQDKDTSANAFWRWFQQNAKAISAEMRSIHTSRGDPEPLMDLIHNALRRVDDGLVFEMGTAADKVDELIVSADGILEKFPAVTSLVSAAPAIDGWRILAFRQRNDGADLAIGTIKLNAQTVFYQSKTAKERIDVRVIFPNIIDVDAKTQSQLAFLLLDMVLGEYDVATSLGDIDVVMIGDGELPNGRPLIDLAKEVDAFQRARAKH